MNPDHIIMRSLIALFLLLFQVHTIHGQTSLNKIDLDKGRYEVGFRHYSSTDSTRTYSRIYDYTNQKSLDLSLLAYGIPHLKML